LDSTYRADAWLIAVEALALGADSERVMQLKDKWNLTDEDGQKFASLVGVKLTRTDTGWAATDHAVIDLAAPRVGYGDTALEALASLARPVLLQITKNRVIK
jgi:hypothetical protein